MTKNNNRNMNAIARGFAIVLAAFTVTVFSSAPVHALSHSVIYQDNGDFAIYDEEIGTYVSMDTYHAAYGYEYNANYDAYGYWDGDSFHTCNCTACNYWKEGHNSVIPTRESENTDDSSVQDEAKAKVYVLGNETGEANLSGEGWSYDQSTGKLTLDSYEYEGTGLFSSSDASDTSNDEDAESDFEEDYEWDDFEEEYGDEDSGSSETVESVKGVIRSDGDLTLVLNGVSRITVTDEESDASYAVNAAGEVKVEGDGVLYIKSATEEKVYGTEPIEETPVGNYENINTNTNDIDNTQTINEAPVTQTVDDGDVNVSNNNMVDMPDFNGAINLPGASNTITFNPTIEVVAPQTPVQRVVATGMQQRHPEISRDTDQSNNDGKLSTMSTEETGTGVMTDSPETDDSIDPGLLMVLISTIVIGAAGCGFLIWKRVRGY